MIHPSVLRTISLVRRTVPFAFLLHIQYPLFQILNAEDPFCPYSDGIKDILSRMMVLTTTPVIMFMTTTAEFIFPMIVHSVLSAHIWKGQEKVRHAERTSVSHNRVSIAQPVTFLE